VAALTHAHAVFVAVLHSQYKASTARFACFSNSSNCNGVLSWCQYRQHMLVCTERMMINAEVVFTIVFVYSMVLAALVLLILSSIGYGQPY
jgi:hypothetical protein